MRRAHGGPGARGGRGGRGQRGIALVTVILALVALAVIAAPFALSMRGLQSQALYGFEQEAARADCDLALAAARSHLEQTHPFLDNASPHADDRAELAPADLAARYPDLLPRAPHGAIRSVTIADEQGKVDLATASPYLLGNLLGGRTVLTADIDERAAALPVAGTAGFPPAGLAWLGAELVEYSAVSPTLLGEVRRATGTATLPAGVALPHRAEDDVLDGRLLLLAQHGWKIRPGVFDGFRRVDGLKEIGLYGPLTYSADELDAARDVLTVHGGPLRFTDSQRVLGLHTARTGGAEVVVPDGRRFGPGSVVQLTTARGEREWNLVLAAADWGGGEGWHLLLLTPPTLDHESGSVAAVLERHPVNVGSAPPRVLAALLAGLGRSTVADVINAREAELLAAALVAVEFGHDADALRKALEPQVRDGRFSAADLQAAVAALEEDDVQPAQLGEEALAQRLTGLVARRSPARLGAAAAEALAERLHAAPPHSHEELAALLEAAAKDSVLREDQRDLVLQNAVDAGDARLIGGTAPFTYASDGVFRLSAAVSRNFPNGKEQARARREQLLSVAPTGESAHVLATQRDFEEASRPYGGLDGWASGPHLLESGPGRLSLTGPGAGGAGAAQAGDTAQAGAATDGADGSSANADGWGGGDALLGAAGAVPVVLGAVPEALELGQAGVTRADTLLAGRPGPTESGPASLSPATVRSALSDTLHFDEGAIGLTGDSPDGFSFAQGAVTLPVAELRPPLVTPVPLQRSFTVEFWFEVPDVEAETILLDGGAGELEDRVLIALTGRELVLRVSDSSLPDFEAQMPPGHGPPAGEIRYAFDDGLVLQPDTPYHVLAIVGGARDTQLALFVDGLPRGHRSFTTRLSEDLDGGGTQLTGIAGYGGETKVRVDSTAGFPARGALRIGREIMEYEQKTDDAFLVQSAGEVDPFGGRGRRGTVAAPHVATEVVELVGWTRALASEQASRGQATLNGELDDFVIAELDPTALQDPIEVEVVPASGGLPITIPLGTGLGASTGTVALRSSGGLPLNPGSFQANGGYAIIFCDYGSSAIAGAEIPNPGSPNNPADTVTLPAQTTNGWLGGAEVIRYQSWNGSALGGVQRGQAGIPVAVGGPGSPLGNNAQIASVTGGSTSWADPREFVTTLDPAILGLLQGLPVNPRVFVFPISVGVTGSNLFDDFHPSPKGELSVPSALVQVGLDFAGEDNASEWMRWDTATSLGFVRDDNVALDEGLTFLMATGLWDPGNGSPTEDTVKQLNDELDFRAQDGTPMGHHNGGDQVLPTIVLGRWFSSGDDPLVGIPGRHDSVTLVNTDGDKEWHRVNHASSNDVEWSSEYSLVGLRDPVTTEFLATDDTDDSHYALAGLPLEGEVAQDSTAFNIIKRLNADSRLYTRMLCAPSGELPSVPIEAFHVGADWSGRRSPGRAIVDELRFGTSPLPSEFLPDNGQYVLAEELKFEEDRQLRLHVEQLVFPYGQRHDPVLGAGALEILSQLPQAGGLLLVGEEIVGYAGLDPVTSGNVFLAARGLYGTQRAYHGEGERVVPLLAWPASPLANALSDTDGRLQLADASAFPAGGGLLWVDDELIGYTGREGDVLLQPVRRGGARLALGAEGLLRGRFGTQPAEHEPGAMVRWMPERVRDRALLGSDVPESERVTVTVRAPGAFFTDVILDAPPPDPKVGLDLRAVFDGRASPHADPATAPGVLALDPRDALVQPSGRQQFALGRQADVLELSLFARWDRDAFDAREYRSNAWKLAPSVRGLVVGHLQPTLVFEQEDHR